jgi:5'-3' exonuclease
MISDLGINIVQDFLGSTTIQQFEIDFNCPVNSQPFTPFQQLLCIMPIKSFKLLPSQYLEIPQQMQSQFPNDFAVDLNGKTNAWEAIVLIPFVDENEVLAEEKQLFERGLTLKESDKVRNSTAFEFYAYKYNPNAVRKQLRSTLTNFKDYIQDYSQVSIVREYENVGTKAFEPKILPGVKHPCPGYPSFKYLNVISLEPDH